MVAQVEFGCGSLEDLSRGCPLLEDQLVYERAEQMALPLSSFATDQKLVRLNLSDRFITLFLSLWHCPNLKVVLLSQVDLVAGGSMHGVSFKELACP